MSIAPFSAPHAFRSVPKTGVIYVTTEAQKLGFGKAPFREGEWVNLGQGMPECGPLPGASPRVSEVLMDPSVHEYAPVPGVWELREAVAEMYNRRFRKGMSSKYTAENVAISPGGRSALTRAAAALGNVHLGHFLPDYTAYEELLDIFRFFTPIPIALEAGQGYRYSAQELEKEIQGRGLAALLFSNPCNPTGQLVSEGTLADWIGVARKTGCALLIDEFYSHYIWNAPTSMVSAAQYVEDVDRDPVVLFDGLTKNWRYSGWRICWTVAPKSVIEAVSSAGSFLDGGASRPLQMAALPLLEDTVIDAENAAIQKVFSHKREYLLKECRSMGMKIEVDPAGTFYVFANLSDLPKSLSDGMSFFKSALQHKVICVPGEYFDVNPGKKRQNGTSRFSGHVRLSFGPSASNIQIACDRLKKMISAQSE